MKHMYLLVFITVSLVIQTAQASIPASERNALLDILEYADPKLQIVESLPIGSECSWSRVTCNKSQENIISLDLFDIGLSNLSPAIEKLTSLEYLDLSFNQLTSLPIEFWQLSTLEYLNIEHNQIASLAQEIKQLTSLKYLNLGFNTLSSLPVEIWQLTSLEELNLEIIQLTTIPPQIEQLANLKYLHLDGTGLTSLPPEIGQLTTLKELNLSNNLLTAIPPEIGQLTDLYALYLNSNNLISLPPELGHLTSLHTLYLRDNLLTTLPDTLVQISGSYFCGLEGCKEGIELYLAGNCLSTSILSPKVIEWLNSDLVSTPASTPLGEQKDICTNEFASLSTYAEVHFRNSHIIDFINTDNSVLSTETDRAIAYTIYEYPSLVLNRPSSALASGFVEKIDSRTWRIDTKDIPVNNEYDIIFWTEDNTYTTGIKAWARTFVYIADESIIPFDIDLTPYFVVSSDNNTYGSNLILNLEHPFFSDDLPPIEQLKQIPGLESLQYNNGLLVLNAPEQQYNLRPFKIEKSSVNSQIGYQLTADGLIKLTTANLRTVTTAPAIANLEVFNTSLRDINLTLKYIGPTGTIVITSSGSTDMSSLFAAMPSFLAQPAIISNSGPGLYLSTANEFPMLPMVYHVYYDDVQEQLMQQAIPSEPYVWYILLNKLESLGFSDITKSQLGIISARKGSQIYRAYMAYDVHISDTVSEEISDFQAIGDLNEDGHQDLLFKFSYQDFPFRSKYAKQVIYLLPAQAVK